MKNVSLGMTLLLVLSACGTQPTPSNITQTPTSGEATSQVSQLARSETKYINEGYTKLSDYAYVRMNIEGKISTIADGKKGQAQILDYLNNAKTNIQSVMVQSTSRDVLESRLSLITNTIHSLESA